LRGRVYLIKKKEEETMRTRLGGLSEGAPQTPGFVRHHEQQKI